MKKVELRVKNVYGERGTGKTMAACLSAPILHSEIILLNCMEACLPC